MRSSFQRGWAAFLLVIMMAVASSTKPLYFNWMVPLTPCEKAIRIWLLQNWPQLPYPLLTMKWHGIGKDTLPQGPIATQGPLELALNSREERNYPCLSPVAAQGKTGSFIPLRLYAKADPRWPWCRKAYLAIMRVKALTLWSLPHLVCIAVAWVRERGPPLATYGSWESWPHNRQSKRTGFAPPTYSTQKRLQPTRAHTKANPAVRGISESILWLCEQVNWPSLPRKVPYSKCEKGGVCTLPGQKSVAKTGGVNVSELDPRAWEKNRLLGWASLGSDGEHAG